MTKTTATILLLISIGLFYSFTSPQYKEVKDLGLLSDEYQGVIDNVSRILETRDNLLTSFESIPKAEKDRLVKILPDNVDTVGLARDLDTIASQYGISISSVQVETGANQNSGLIVLPDYDTAYDTASVSFSFVSNYSNFIKFLADLEKSLRVMDVKFVSFRVGDTALYEHQITLDTYWLK